jgi:hypothetical protein
MSESESKSETCVVACWWVGRCDSGWWCMWRNATKWSNQAIKKTRKYMGW